MLERICSLLWGWHVLLLILAAGVFFTFSTGFFQVRHMGRWLRSAWPDRARKGGISGFQALTTALGGSIGTGNIVGVAVALTAGGPGALFWMWISSFFGMMTVFAENLLAARHREAPGTLGTICGVAKGLGAVYAVGCCLSSLGMGNMAQTHAAARALEDLGVPLWAVCGGLSCLVLAVAWGGLHRAVQFTEKLVPLMTVLFFGASLGVLWVERARLPAAAASVFQGALSLRAGAGGAAGALLALRTGVSRGVFTNEAGLGSSAFAYGEVRDKTPVELGCMGIFQVFLDTLVMCTVTGLCLLCCRSSGLEGAEWTFFAYERALGPAGGAAVSLCTALFAVATVSAWCCYGREGLLFLTRGRGKRVYAVVAAVAAGAGCLLPLDAVFRFGDAMNGLMAVPNVTALFCCAGEVRRAVREQERSWKEDIAFSRKQLDFSPPVCYNNKREQDPVSRQRFQPAHLPGSDPKTHSLNLQTPSGRIRRRDIQ